MSHTGPSLQYGPGRSGTGNHMLRSKMGTFSLKYAVEERKHKR